MVEVTWTQQGQERWQSRPSLGSQQRRPDGCADDEFDFATDA